MVCSCKSLLAQHSYSDLEQHVNALNKTGKFEEAIREIAAFETREDHSQYDLYKCQLLKSYVYKALFNYDKTFECLDKARQHGISSDKPAEVIATINAEKAFALFDIMKYEEAARLMGAIKKSGYQYIELKSVGYLLMQEGYISFLKKDYATAESRLNEAIVTLRKASPIDLPIVYGKIILLHAETKNYAKCLDAYRKGTAVAKQYSMVKYMIYLDESLRTFYEKTGQWEKAERLFHRIDSLGTVYNAGQIDSKIKLLEKDMQLQQKDHQLKKEALTMRFLLLLLALLLIVIYVGFRFSRERRKKSEFLEKENNRIHDELQLLMGKLDEAGLHEFDLAAYQFTERQMEIIALLKKGKSNKEIGNQLFISENTVKYHLKSIYTTLGVENRTVFIKMLLR